MKAAVRSFRALREPPRLVVVPEEKYFALAMYRLSIGAPQPDDGKLLIAWLRQTSTEVVLPETSSDSALWKMEGRRQVPADLDRIIRIGEREFTGPK